MLQRVLAQLQSSNTPTVSDLTRNTDIDLQKLAEAVALEHYSGMDTLALNLQEEINLGSGITGKTEALEARIAEPGGPDIWECQRGSGIQHTGGVFQQCGGWPGRGIYPGPPGSDEPAMTCKRC